jgi:hypothetical protein
MIAAVELPLKSCCAENRGREDLSAGKARVEVDVGCQDERFAVIIRIGRCI